MSRAGGLHGGCTCVALLYGWILCGALMEEMNVVEDNNTGKKPNPFLKLTDIAAIFENAVIATQLF